jgi:hypothetical protein
MTVRAVVCACMTVRAVVCGVMFVQYACPMSCARHGTFQEHGVGQKKTP